MSIWYSRRKKEEKSLRLAAAGKSAFCFAELHYNARSLTHAAGVAAERKPLSAFFERILSKNYLRNKDENRESLEKSGLSRFSCY